MAYHDVRGPDGRLLFRFDPDRMLVEIVRREQTYTVDLTAYLALAARPAVVEVDPLSDLDKYLTPNSRSL